MRARWTICLVVAGIAYGYFLHRDRLFPYWLGQNLSFVSAAPIVPPPTDKITRDYFAAFPGRTDVVMVGDSITQMARFDAMFPDLRVVNQGVGGDTVTGLLSRIKEVQAAGAKTIALLFGQDDLGAYHQPVSDVFARYMTAVRRLKEADNCVLVQSTLLTRRTAALNSRIAELNRRLAEACAATGLCRFVDLNATIAPGGVRRPDTTFDGVHPTAAMLVLWRDALKPAFEACRRR